MNNFVTYETALRLRAAGFPQPEPKAGQMWYDPYDVEHIVTSVDEWHVNLAPLSEVVNYTEEFDYPDFPGVWHFAPGPAEILLKLGPDFQIGVQWKRFWCGRIAGESGEYATHSESMAEACAQKWLLIHEKKQ